MTRWLYDTNANDEGVNRITLRSVGYGQSISVEFNDEDIDSTLEMIERFLMGIGYNRSTIADGYRTGLESIQSDCRQDRNLCTDDNPNEWKLRTDGCCINYNTDEEE